MIMVGARNVPILGSGITGHNRTGSRDTSASDRDANPTAIGSQAHGRGQRLELGRMQGGAWTARDDRLAAWPDR